MKTMKEYSVAFPVPCCRRKPILQRMHQGSWILQCLVCKQKLLGPVSGIIQTWNSVRTSNQDTKEKVDGNHKD